jgi:hypothetical protein
MIQWARVMELRDEIGREDFEEVVDLFLEEVDEVVDRLRQKAVLTQLEQDLHFLKGSALNFGFSAFSHLCQVGAQKSAEGAAATVDLEKIIHVFDLTKSQFVAELPGYLTT